MQKPFALSLFLAVGLICAGHVSAQALTGCAAKKADVQAQLEQARAHGNKAQEAKLKIAQKQLETNCTDEGLRREREADVKKKEEKVAARQADLDKANAKGKPKKIAQQEKKLHDAEAELKDARDKLAQ
ncbi:DUF1090 domain-containing protein [Herbaspirillum chlorophenolicum]|uniref:DUF1090 domain-containing protein n=1 Tax=Herbaspirillum chlorophenolicum TaxID=211589 RepID=UPI00067D1529|nr:DUF1090 domain-containing protein [Herbaspirillum chlorophenolicum]